MCSCLSFPLFSNPHLCMCVYWYVYERGFRSGFDSALCLWLNVLECSCFGYCFDTVILFCLRLHVEVSVKLKTYMQLQSQQDNSTHTITCCKGTRAGQNNKNFWSCFYFFLIINTVFDINTCANLKKYKK